MSVMTLRRAMMRPRATMARTFLLTAAAVIGVLIGLLGMHVLSTSSTHHAPAVVGEAAHHASTAAIADTTAPDHAAVGPCAGACGGDMDAMAFMACVLALLAASVILAIRPARVISLRRALAPPPVAVAVIEAEPVPPDLVVLSISRT